ncbi:type III-B CRISPR-associated protein Cas10/Cmr2 [Hydrogenivirga sp.]
MKGKLLIFSFSPVQGFISASRRPRDLFTASFILSYLTKELIEKLRIKDKVIYPVIGSENEGNLANYPNRFIAMLEKDVNCEDIKGQFKNIWVGICQKIWNGLSLKLDNKSEVENQFWLHVNSYFNPFCLCLDFVGENKWKEVLDIKEGVPAEDDYAFTYDLAERLLGAKKSWRPYEGLIDAHKGERYPDGCTMCGERLHLAFNWKNIKSKNNKEGIFKDEDARHIRESEKLCGVCLVKRFAVKYYFKDKGILKEDFWHFPSTEEIAGIKFKERLKDLLKNERDGELLNLLENLSKELEDTPYIIKNPIIKTMQGDELDSELFRTDGWEGLFKNMEEILDNENKVERIRNTLTKVVNKLDFRHRNPYFALLISDGDNIGDWLGIKSSIRKEPLSEDFHKKFSKTLSEYAKEVSELHRDKFPRQMIYAGGDDVMAFLHPLDAVEYAEQCNKKFEAKLSRFAEEGRKPSVSAGILITHAKMSLQKALEEARNLEKIAKSVEGKGAVCVGVMTRSGSLTSFVSKWGDLELYKELSDGFKNKKIGSTIVYDLRLLRDKLSGDFEEGILISLMKRSVSRKTADDVDKENLVKLIGEFYKKSKEYKNKREEEAQEFAIKNLIDLFYVARFVGTLEEVQNEGLQG